MAKKNKGHRPLKVLESGLIKLNNKIRARGGKHFRGNPGK